MSETKTAKRLTGGIIAIIVLAVCLCITTFALVYASVSVENNLFHTGEVRINLNDGKPVIREHEFIFEPGMTVVKDFFIENDSTWDVYYRLYLDNVSGGLSDVLTVTIKDSDRVLYSGTANELTRQNVIAADDTLKIGQRRNLTVVFHYPENSGNDTAGAIHGTGTAKITVDATTVYGTYVSNYAMAVCASSRSEIIIKGGEFANQAPAGSALSLIYAEDNAKITIEGGTFKCVSPEWTLNCNDSDAATITVKGGSFYKFDPSNDTVGEGEIFVADGYKVVQNGDWYNVVPE